eukprot:3786015-Rhodomonas_salina.1
MHSERLQENSGATVAASDGRAASGKAVLQQICAQRAFQPIQHLCRSKQPIWTPTRCMCSGMLQGHVGAKVAVSDGRAASRKGSLCPMRFPANSAFVPRQAADLDSDARHAL